jgi:hypothetical protein
MGWRDMNTWNKLVMPLGVLDAFLLDKFQKIEQQNYTCIKKNPTIV